MVLFTARQPMPATQGIGVGQGRTWEPMPGTQLGLVWTQDGLRVETEGVGVKPVTLSGYPYGGVGFYGAIIKRLEWRPLTGRITYVRQVDGVPQVFVAEPDGTHEKQLTYGEGDKQCPRFSPYGTQIAPQSGGVVLVVYPDGSIRQEESEGLIYVMNSDGSGDHLVQTSTTVGQRSPSWTPSGELVFAGPRHRGFDLDLWRIRPDGQGLQRLTTTPTAHEDSPDCSPDGSRIAYVRSGRDEDTEIWVMQSDGSNQTQLTNNTADDRDPRWSPDNGSIVFCSNRDGNWGIYKMQADGSNQTRLTNNSFPRRVPRLVS